GLACDSGATSALANERPGFHARPILLCVACQPVPFEDINHALRDIEERRCGRLGYAEVGDEPTRGTAMRDGDRVARKPLVPIPHTRRNRFIAFAAWRNEMPLVVLARGNALRVACAQLRDREALPVAEGYFGKPLVDAVALRRETERRPYQFHGRTRTAKRACDKIEFRDAAAGARKEIAEYVAAARRLHAPAFVERHVAAALQSPDNVPVGFTVTDVENSRPYLCRLGHQSILPTVMSGASGCFIPTI